MVAAVRRRRVLGPGRSIGEIGGQAAAYRRLLVDPCNSPLVPTPYEGSLSGTVQREVGGVVGSQPNGIYFWHPHYGLFGFEAPAAATTGNVTLLTGGSTAPGRAIAGCMSVAWLGSEATRQGMVYCGVVPGSLVWGSLATTQGGAGGSALSAGAAAFKLTEQARMPVEKCEVNWFPGEGDSEQQLVPTYDASQNNALKVAFASTNFCCINVVGGVALSHQIKTTGITEKGNNSSTGATSWNVAAPDKPPYDWKTVLTSLTQKDPSWYLDTFRKVATIVGGTAGAYATSGLPGALGYLTASYAGMRVAAKQTVMAG